MKYMKPSLTALGIACRAIQQFHSKFPHNVADSDPKNSMLSSGGAYDLDE
jgi:hypothetical protein